MRTRISAPLSGLVLALVASLTLGVTGTAAGAALTNKTVKKIAAKVVTKKAKGLHVASADRAGDTATLAGQPAAAYLSEAHRFVLSGSTTAGTLLWTFTGLPAGAYEVSWSVIVVGGGSPAFCNLTTGATGALQNGFAYGTGPSLVTISSSAIVQVVPGAATQLVCAGGVPITLYTDATHRSTVDFVRLDSVVEGTASD